MAKQIKGTQHIKKKRKPIPKFLLGIMVLIIVSVLVWTTGIYKKVSVPKFTNLKSSGQNEDTEVLDRDIDINQAGLVIGGEIASGSIISVSPGVVLGADVVGTGTLKMSNLQSQPGDDNSYFLEVGATCADNFEFSGWTIKDQKGNTLQKDIPAVNPLRIYYYNDTSKLGLYRGVGFTAYVTNQSIVVEPKVTPILKGDRTRYIDVITSPNIGETHFWIYEEKGSTSGWPTSGRTGALSNHYADDRRYLGFYLNLNDSENKAFDDDSRMMDVNVYTENGKLYHSHTQPANTCKDDTFPIDDPGNYTVVLSPHLKSSDYRHQAIAIALPSNHGSAIWNGSQVIATPNDGYLFDHWLYGGEGKSTDNPLAAKPIGIEVYRAYFREAKYNVDVARVTPGNSATVTGTGNIDKGKDAVITVTPNAGYKFKDASWTTTDGINHNATDAKTDGNGVTTFTIPNVQEDIGFNVDMESTKFTISVKASPVDGGNVKIKNETSGTTEQTSSEDFAPGDKATLTATPADGKTFLYWEDSNGNRYENATLIIDKVYGSESFTAYFAPAKVNFSINPNGGTVAVNWTDGKGNLKSNNFTGMGDVNIDDTNGIQPNSNVTLTIVAEPEGMHFSYYRNNDSSDTNIYKDTQTVVHNVIKDITYTAYYIGNTCDITAEASPADGGIVTILDIDNPDIHSNFPTGHEIKLTATADSEYSFLYFKDKFGNIINTNDYQFKAVADETYTAWFTKNSINIKTKVDSDNKGKITVCYTDPSGAYVTKSGDNGDFTVKGGTSFTIKGDPDPGYRLAQITDNRIPSTVYPVSGNNNTYTFTNVMSDIEYTVSFQPCTCTIEVMAEPAGGGDVSMEYATGDYITPGSDNVNIGKNVVITATPTDTYNFLYFIDSVGNKYTTNQLTFRAYGNDKFTAYFAQDTVVLSIDINPSEEAGTVQTTYTKKDSTGRDTVNDTHIEDIKSNTDVVIKAKELNGYHFVEFIADDGSRHTENPYAISAMTQNQKVSVIFAADESTITGISVPEMGGSIKVNGTNGSNNVEYGSNVVLEATPNDGYTFKYFEDQSGNHYTGTVSDGKGKLEFKAVNGSETYKAYFVKNNLTITLDMTPNDCGTVSLNDNAPVSERTSYEVDGRSNIKLTANAADGKSFSYWTDQDGNKFQDNPLTIVDISKDIDFTAVFDSKKVTISAITVPETGGSVTVNGKNGSSEVEVGADVVIEASPESGYSFNYFVDSEGNQIPGIDAGDGKRRLEFKAINGNESYKAYFINDNVSITIDLTPSGSGTVRFNDENAVSSRTTYSVDSQSNIKLTAMAKEGKEFSYWKDKDGNSYADNPLTIVDISKSQTYTAVFDSEITGIRAVASPASGGRIRKLVNDDGSITLIAMANKGYDFVNWDLPDSDSSSEKITISADDVHDGDTYKAIFKIDKNYDAKTDITQESFYKEWRKVNTPNYTVTRDSMKLLAMQTVSGLRQYDDATPGLKTYSAISSAKAYFDERTAKAIQRLDGLFGDSELMTAEGEVLDVDLLPDRVFYQRKADEFTAKKFGKKYDTEILTVKKVLEPSNFNSLKRTYLWRYTGAVEDDNIYLLYDMNGKKPAWATPIVDEDGVLKFTLDKLNDEEIVTVVRVKIKK